MNKQAAQAYAYAQQLARHSLPHYDLLPSFGVYVDQLVSFVNETVGIYAMPGEKLLTAAMVNNYVKLGVIPKPEKKKYTRNHIAYLVVVCILKKVFSIQEIAELIHRQIESYPTSQAYDSFIELLEQDIAEIFSQKGTLERVQSTGILLVDRAVSAFSSKLFIQALLTDTIETPGYPD